MAILETLSILVAVHRPENEADWLECRGAHDGEDEFYEGQTRANHDIVVGVDLEASIGANLVGSAIAGSGFSSSMTFEPHCVAQGCPIASWSYRSGTDPKFTMEDLRLYATNFDVVGSTGAVTIERARVELWRQVSGIEVVGADGDGIHFVVPAGQAWFYVAGMAKGGFGQFMTVNATDIELGLDGGVWTIGAFDIENVDGEGRTWTLRLEGSRWRE